MALTGDVGERRGSGQEHAAVTRRDASLRRIARPASCSTWIGSPGAVARLALHCRAEADKRIELLVALRTGRSRIAEACVRGVPGVSRAVEVFSDRGPLDDVT